MEGKTWLDDRASSLIDEIPGAYKDIHKVMVDQADLVEIVDGVESQIASREVREMSSQEIGNWVIEELRRLDQVAYVRFASVYRRFEDVQEFVAELKDLLETRK